jgi:ribosomal protein S27E
MMNEEKKGEADTGIKLKCKRCNHKWMYHGKSDWYTSCPICKAMVDVRKVKKGLGLLVE